MISWLQKHIFFPKEIGAVPIFYLIFMIPYVVNLFPFDSWQDLLNLALVLVFYKVYRDAYIEEKQSDLLFYCQMAVASAMTLFSNYASVFIFFAWGFNYWSISEDTRRKYILIYYISSIGSVCLSLWNNISMIPSDEWAWIGMSVIFIVLSPILARVAVKEQEKITLLKQNDSRLEMIVRQSERDRIARDLHDNLGQAYTTMTIKAELASKLVTSQPNQAIQELQEIASMSRSNLNLVRRIIANMQEREIALAMVDASKTLSHCKITLNSENEVIASQWPLEVQYAFAACIKEATTNIIRHSQATRANYRFSESDKEYRVEIKDNGKGLIQTGSTNFGIQGMVQRIEAMNGEIELVDSRGVLISMMIPKERE